MTREQFLNTKFPVKPYLIHKRGPSTPYSESFHVINSNTRNQLNFWWTNSTPYHIIISLYDYNEPNDLKRLSRVYEGEISQSIIEETINKHL